MGKIKKRGQRLLPESWHFWWQAKPLCELQVEILDEALSAYTKETVVQACIGRATRFRQKPAGVGLPVVVRLIVHSRSIGPRRSKPFVALMVRLALAWTTFLMA